MTGVGGVVGIADFYAFKVNIADVLIEVFQVNGLRKYGSAEGIAGVGEILVGGEKTPRSIGRELVVDAENDFPAFHYVESRHGIAFIGIGGDNFPGCIEGFQPEQMFGSEYEVVRGKAVDVVAVAYRGHGEVAACR